MAQPEHSPDDFGEVSGLPVSLELEDGAGRPVGQFAGNFELSRAAEILGVFLETVEQAVNDLADRNGLKGLRVNEAGLHSVSAGAPLVLADQKGVTVVLIGAAIDLLGQVVDQALDQ